MNETTNTNVRYDSGTPGSYEIDPAEDRHSLQTYVSDMLALEQHIRAPLGRQAEDKATLQFTGASEIISSLTAISDAHISALKAQLAAMGGHEASGVKSVWATMLGAGAAAVDSLRKTRVSKCLRDDYTAISLAVVSYTMLYTTALGLGDSPTAMLAQRHLEDLTPMIVQIGRAIPKIVLEELSADGENVNMSVADIAELTVERSWQPSETL